MQVKAQAKWVKISPRKVRRVIALIRKKKASNAMDTLKVLPQRGANLIAKVLKSAIANAKNNHKLAEAKLYVCRAIVDEAPSYKKFKSRSRGRVSPIMKRNSHISIWVEEKKEKGV